MSNPNLNAPNNLGPVVLPEPGRWGITYSPAKPTDILTAEAAIKAQLAAFIPAANAEVTSFPDDPLRYRMTHRNAVVMTRYFGSDYHRDKPIDIVANWRVMRFEVGILSRNLGWNYGGAGDTAPGANPGAYTLIETIRRALTGMMIPGFKKAYPLEDSFRDYKDGTWYYRTLYGFETLAMEQDLNPNWPTLTTVTLDETGGTTSIAVPTAQMTFSNQNTIALGHENVSNVTVSALGGALYAIGTDYTVDWVNGIITRLTTGSIPANATVNVSFTYADVVTAVASGGNAPTSPSN